MKRRFAPPRLARALLRLALPTEVRDGAVDDLDEKFATYAVSGMGAARARNWYRRQVAGALHPRFWKRPFGGGSHTAHLLPPRRRTGLAFNAMQDVRFGVRMLATNPVLTAVIVVTLAVGLGFNGAIFSLVNTIILNDIPVEEFDRVLLLESNNLSQGRESLSVSYLDYRDFAQNESFESFAAWYRVTLNLTDGVGAPERFTGLTVDPAIFDVLRVEPLLGRRFSAADSREGADRVVLVGHSVWQTRYGGDENILGRVIQVNGLPRSIIGVLPPVLEQTPFTPDFWFAMIPTEQMQTDRGRRFLQVAGRLTADASREQAEAEMEQVAGRVAAEHRDTNEGVGVVVGNFHEFTDGGNEAIVLILLGAVGFLLLIACANVANLLISRSLQRGREVAIRAALGAGRWRIVRQLLIESLLLSAISGIAAIALAIWGIKTLERAISAATPPAFWDFSMRPSVYVYVLGLAVATTVLFGLVPALHATRGDLRDSLKEGDRGSGGRGTRRVTGTLVVAQIAFSLVLLAGAGSMVRSTLNVLDVDWSIPTDDVLSFRLTLPTATYESEDSIVAFHRELGQRLAAIPSVELVSRTSDFPTDSGFVVTAELEGRPVADGNQPATLSQMVVSPEYFTFADVAPIRGRLFDTRDGLDGELVVVVERRLAELYWPGEDALGKRLRWVGETENRWVEIVGVIPDLTQTLNLEIMGNVHPIVYTPYAQEPIRTIGYMVRSPADPETLAQQLRSEVQSADANLPIFDIATLEEIVAERTFGFRIVSVLFIMLGVIALFLACVGIYSVMAFAVGARQREIGIRMALGARSSEIVGLVARTSMLQMTIGLVLGLAGAVGLTQLLTMFMYEVSASDPLTFLMVLVLLGGTSIVAATVPARRASRVDPLEALRSD